MNRLLQSTNPSDPPLFYRMGDFQFQEMCRELFEREEGVRWCEIYGKRGQSQRGVDLKAVTHQDTVQVGQCKCHQHFPPREIKKAGDEFVAHLTFWRAKKINRFILFIASPLETTQQHDEIDEQTERFRKEGIVFEPWSARTLLTKLKNHPDIVLRHTRSDELVRVICGPTIDRSPPELMVEQASGLVQSVISSQIPLYASSLSREIGVRLERIRDIYRTGRRRAAYSELIQIREDASWAILENPLKAKILRVQAGYRLDMHSDVEGARQLADEAMALHCEGDETLIRAFISYYSDGPSTALKLVGSPNETGILNARVAFLLEVGRSSEAIAEIKKASQIKPDLETQRLHALALLLSRDVEAARTTIEKALSIEPNWEFLRFTGAVIDYCFCLGPSSLPENLAHWPEPLGWAVIRNNDKTRERLRFAEQTFDALRQITERGDEWRRTLKIWKLACIANDSSRQVEARDFCRELLSTEPIDFRAFAWAQVRDLEVDFRQAEQRLSELSRSDAPPETRMQAAGALINYYLHQGNISAAEALLNRCRQDLTALGAQSNLTRWDIQILIHSGRTKEAVDRARQERDSELRQSILLNALKAHSDATDDYRPYLRQLKRYYNRTQRADYLLELCWVYAEREEWSYIADKSKELVDGVQTSAAVRLVANALWRVGRKEKCFKLLDASVRHFPGSVLPGDLWRLRIEHQAERGNFLEAIGEAKELVRAEDSTQNVLTLLQAQLRYGDLKAFSVTARDLIVRRDADPQTLVQVARWVSLEDPELARKLWRQAQESADTRNDPQYLNVLIEAGYMLGLDAETGPLLENAQKLSQENKGPLRLLKIDDFIAEQRKHLQHRTELLREYERGVLPLHILGGPFERTLVDLLHGLPGDSARNFRPLVQPRIFIRHGGRAINNEFATASSAWCLCLDITALIIANHLELLDVLEKSFKPLMISPSLMTALLLQQQKLQSVQPSQIEKCSAILKLVEKGVIRCRERAAPITQVNLKDLSTAMGDQWVSDLQLAHLEDGFLVDYLPLRTHVPPIQPLILPASYESRVIGIETLIHNLRGHGWISPEIEVAQVASCQNGLIPEGTKLLFHGNVLESIHDRGMLTKLCEHYEVSIDPVYLDYAHGISHKSTYLESLKPWLQQLIQRVRDGLAAGIYQCLRVSDEHFSDEPHDDSDFGDSRTIRELLTDDLPVGSVVWIDDRFVNSHLQTEVAPIIGINEVLSALRNRRLITDSEYFEKLLQLRSGNFRYIPISSEELLWHLNKAPIVNSQLKETPALEVMRRYIAACLLDIDCLQIIAMQPGSTKMLGEVQFILETRRALDEALVTLWKNEGLSIEVMNIRANWVLANVYTGCFGIRHLLPNTDNRGDASFLMGLDIAGMISAAVLSLGNPFNKDVQTRRKAFLEWYENRVMLPRLTANPETSKIAAQMIGEFINHAAKQHYRTDLEEKASRLIKHHLFIALPEEIKTEIELPTDVMEWCGIKQAAAINIGDLDFDQKAFARALETLWNGQTEVRISDFLESGEFVLRRVMDGEDVEGKVELIDDSRKVLACLKDDFLGLALPGVEERTEVLRRNRHWFDSNRDTFESEVTRIAKIEDVDDRMLQVQHWRVKSLEVFYRELASRLSRRPEFKWSELIPTTTEGLLNHFRLLTNVEADSDFSEIWQKCARELKTDEGIEVALDRIALLPIRIPEFLVQAVRELADSDRESLLEKCRDRWRSPAARLNFIDLSMRASDSEAPPSSVIQDAVSELYAKEGLKQYRLFESFHRFVNDRFASLEGIQTVSDSTRLIFIFAHAARLHQIFNSLNADVEKLTEMLNSFIGNHSTSEVLHRSEGMWRDVLYWRRFNRELLLTHGVGALLAEHGYVIAEALGLKQKMEDLCFREDNRSQLRPLLLDPEVTTNLTGSFLGGEHSEVIERATGEDMSGLSSPSLRLLVVRALEELETNPISQEWGTFDLVFGDLACYPDVSYQLKTLVEKMDFRAAYEKDPFVALLAFRIASHQAIYWNDDALRARLERELLALLQFNSKEFDNFSPDASEARIASLLDSALRLSIRLDNPQESSRQFSGILSKALDVAPEVVEHLGAGFVELLLQLPASHLHGMWPLLLKVRATADKPL